MPAWRDVDLERRRGWGWNRPRRFRGRGRRSSAPPARMHRRSSVRPPSSGCVRRDRLVLGAWVTNRKLLLVWWERVSGKTAAARASWRARHATAPRGTTQFMFLRRGQLLHRLLNLCERAHGQMLRRDRSGVNAACGSPCRLGASNRLARLGKELSALGLPHSPEVGLTRVFG